MILFKRIKISFILLPLLLINTSLFAQTDSYSKIYPLPLFELEKVLNNWLELSGFETRRTLLEMGKVQYVAKKENDVWQISLGPHSPLATKIQIKHNLDGERSNFQLRDFWGYVAGYVTPQDDKSSGKTNGDNNNVVPPAVYSHIESVVCIKINTEDDEMQLSGFIIDQDGLIICTAHNLKGLQKITVVLHDGRQLNANLIEADTHSDLALLHVEGKFETYVLMAEGRNLLYTGESLYSVGCPINVSGTIYTGIVNGPPRLIDDLPLWQVNMEIHPGSSGSPVFDAQGNFVAIVKGRYLGTSTIAFLIPLETIMTFALDVCR